MVSKIVEQLFGILRIVPSLAILFLCIPFLGTGNKPTLVALTILGIPPILINTTQAFANLDKSTLEAAKGMGMNHFQVTKEVQFPLALPSIIAGIRLAIIATTGTATIAASINAGGLGIILFSGLRTDNIYKILWGAILATLIAYIADTGLKAVKNRIKTKYQ